MEIFSRVIVSKLGWKTKESHSNFLDINKTSVTETFQEIVPISESYPLHSNFKVAPKPKRKQDDHSTYGAFLLKQLHAMESQDEDADMLFLKSLHGSFQKLSEEKKEAMKYKYNNFYITQDSHRILVLNRVNLIQS